MELTRKPPAHRRFERTRAAPDERGSFFLHRAMRCALVLASRAWRPRLRASRRRSGDLPHVW